MKINFNETMITNMDIEKTGSTFFKITITMLDGRTLIAENVNLNVFNIEYEEEEYYDYREGSLRPIKTVIPYYKLFLNGLCGKDENGVMIKMYEKDKLIK